MADVRTILSVDALDVATDRIEIPVQDWQPLGGVQTDVLKRHSDELLRPKIQIGPLDV